MRYPTEQRIAIYKQIADWLGFQPALCKEAIKMWEALGWHFTDNVEQDLTPILSGDEGRGMGNGEQIDEISKR